MRLYRHFKSNADTMLPDPLDLLLKTVPSTAITSANRVVRHMYEAQQATQPTKRGLYARFTPEQKAEVGKQAVEHGMVATVCYYCWSACVEIWSGN